MLSLARIEELLGGNCATKLGESLFIWWWLKYSNFNTENTAHRDSLNESFNSQRKDLKVPLSCTEGFNRQSAINEWIIGRIKFFFKPDFNRLVSQHWLSSIWDDRMLVICVTSGRPLMMGERNYNPSTIHAWKITFNRHINYPCRAFLLGNIWRL